ncbi:DsrE family protein [Gemmatimonadota bacterium]
MACVPQGEASQADAPADESTTQVSDAAASSAPTRLAVVWSSADREVALKVTFMYTLNAKSQGWFDEVTLIVWGPSSLLLSQDEELQEYVARMQEAGVEVVACQACADSYGVSDALRGFGVDVKYMGRPLTEMLQGDWKVLTF